MSKIICPCENCICFPVCKAQVDEYIGNGAKKYKSRYKPIEFDLMYITYYMYRDVLKSKCDIIKNWVEDKSLKDYSEFRRLSYMYESFGIFI